MIEKKEEKNVYKLNYSFWLNIHDKKWEHTEQAKKVTVQEQTKQNKTKQSIPAHKYKQIQNTELFFHSIADTGY